jgi:hypothetical protein
LSELTRATPSATNTPEIINFQNADQYPAPSLTNITDVDTLLAA